MPWITAREREREHAERERLLSLVERLSDNLVRLERKREGLSEAPPQKKEPIIVPDDLDAWITAWGSDATQQAQRARVLRLYTTYRDWDRVRSAVFSDTEEEA